MLDVLLETKVHPPSLQTNLINRTPLIQRLHEGILQGCRLTLVSAPAGYGKSTLLSEWVSQASFPFAWLSLDSGENNPARFWNYFTTALNTIPQLHQAGIGAAICQAVRISLPTSMEGPLAALLNDFSGFDEPVVLVLDDLHTITERQIHQDLVYLVNHLPRSEGGLHLVVTSRMDPPWPLARWRGRAELNELRTADLRFNYDETAQFLGQSLPHEFSSQAILALQERTEGWIAGLQMAAVSMRGWLQTKGPQGLSQFIETFTGTHKFILDFLVEEVISQQSLPVQEFLHATAILEQLTAPLCDALTGLQGSQSILDQIEKANLFLIPLDDERKWFRYHHLFADLLHKRLMQVMPEHVPELHRRASLWYAGNQMLSKAIQHALSAGDALRVNELVSGNALAIVEQSELLDVLKCFEKIPQREMTAKPWLWVAYAWTKAYVDPSAGMSQILEQAENGLTCVEAASERQHLMSHLDAIRAYVAWIKGEADSALAFSRQALGMLPEDDWITRTHLLNIEGLAHQYLGNLVGAIQSFEAAILAGGRTGRVYETFNAYTNLAFVYLLQGRLQQVCSLCQHVFNLVESSGQVSSSLPVLAYAYATISLVQLEWNEVAPAQRNAQQGVALAEQWHQADALHFSLTCLSRILCGVGDLEAASAINQRAMRLAAGVSSWFFRISIYDQVQIDLMKGDIPAAISGFEQLKSLVDQKKKGDGTLYLQACLYYSQGRFSEVLTILDTQVGNIKEGGEQLEFLRSMPLQALALQALNREGEALRVLEHCLALVKTEGFVRIFVDRGEPMARLLQLALSKGIEPAYIQKLLPDFKISWGSHQNVKPAVPSFWLDEGGDLIQPLSERELEVLRYLNTSLSTPEIAQELIVAPSTIRTHVRNIYHKLDVHNRFEALKKAEDLGLI